MAFTQRFLKSVACIVIQLSADFGVPEDTFFELLRQFGDKTNRQRYLLQAHESLNRLKSVTAVEMEKLLCAKMDQMKLEPVKTHPPAVEKLEATKLELRAVGDDHLSMVANYVEMTPTHMDDIVHDEDVKSGECSGNLKRLLSNDETVTVAKKQRTATLDGDPRRRLFATTAAATVTVKTECPMHRMAPLELMPTRSRFHSTRLFSTGLTASAMSVGDIVVCWRRQSKTEGWAEGEVMEINRRGSLLIKFFLEDGTPGTLDRCKSHGGCGCAIFGKQIL